jgi:hypothetical protein
MNRQQKGEAYRAALTAAADSLARSRINSIAAEILDDPLLGLAVLTNGLDQVDVGSHEQGR